MENDREALAVKTMDDLYGVKWKLDAREGEPPEAADVMRAMLLNTFADSWSRTAIDAKTREMVGLGMMIGAGGCDQEVRNHVSGALAIGVTKAQIVDVFMHAVGYLGAIRTGPAWSVARRVLASVK